MQGTIIFLRKIMRGGANKSFGIEVAQLAGVDKNVTDRAKQILKRLEASDLNSDKSVIAENGAKEKKSEKLSEAERIIQDLDIDNLSPMQAFTVLADLSEKVKNKNL